MRLEAPAGKLAGVFMCAGPAAGTNAQAVMQGPVVREIAGIGGDQVIMIAMDYPDETFPANTVQCVIAGNGGLGEVQLAAIVDPAAIASSLVQRGPQLLSWP